MKLKRFEILLTFSIFYFCIFSFSEEKSKNKVDFFYGSVVKSETWEIDRVKNIEKFSGKVSFRNKDYKMNSDYATYFHKDRIWDISGNVYCLRNFSKNLKLEAFCDSAKYFENLNKANLDSGQNNYVKIIYYDQYNRKLTCLSKKVMADNNTQIIEFTGDFVIYTDSGTIKGENGVYDHKTEEFTITGKRPTANAFQQDYETYVEGNLMKLNKNTMAVSVYGNVKGLIIGKDIKLEEKLKGKFK